MSDDTTMVTYYYKFKCLDCGMHFCALSWDKDWIKKHGKPCCVECGKSERFLYWIDSDTRQIFETVPGASGSPEGMIGPTDTMGMLGEIQIGKEEQSND